MEGNDPMKKTLIKILCFALVLFLLLGASALVERLQPTQEDTAEITTEETATQSEELPFWNRTPSLEGATGIYLSVDYAWIQGSGAVAAGQNVTIAYPGTYQIAGTLTDGSITVDCEMEGEVYLLLAGANIHSSTGPAIHVKSANPTMIYLVGDTESFLSDGSEYAVVTGIDGQPEPKQPDAVIYSGDDLVIAGEGGSLTIEANYANAVHSRDELCTRGGTLAITAVQDGLKAADGVLIDETALALTCGDDGISSSKGSVEVYYSGVFEEKELSVNCGGTAITAREYIDLSAGAVTISDCNKGLEAPVIRLYDAAVTITADDTAIAATMGEIDSGFKAADCAVKIYGGSLYALAPCCVRSDGAYDQSGGAVFLRALSAENTPLKAADSAVSGGTLFLCGDFEASVLTRTGGVNAVYYRADSPVAAGQTVSIADAEGNTCFALTPNTEFYAVLIAYNGLVQGGSYTLNCGSTAAAFTQSDWLATAAVQSFGGFGGFGGGRGGGPGGGGPRP